MSRMNRFIYLAFAQLHYSIFRIVILMRGLPGSGKSHVARLIKNKETDIGGPGKVRILSIDDYFTSENDGESDKIKNDVSKLNFVIQ